MPGDAAQRRGAEAGTASVELVAVVPLLILVVAAAAQLALVGAALWSAGVAARAGARAALVDGDAAAAARRALPEALRAGARVRSDGEVSVSVPVPGILPFLPRLSVDAATSLEGDG